MYIVYIQPPTKDKKWQKRRLQITGRTVRHWILLLLNQQKMYFNLTIGRSHLINKHPRQYLLYIYRNSIVLSNLRLAQGQIGQEPWMPLNILVLPPNAIQWKGPTVHVFHPPWLHPLLSSQCMYRFTTLPHPHGHWQLQELLGNQCYHYHHLGIAYLDQADLP